MDLFEDAKGLRGEEALLVRCMLMRAAYGGMSGDVDLLKGGVTRASLGALLRVSQQVGNTGLTLRTAGSAEMWAHRLSGAADPPPSLMGDTGPGMQAGNAWLPFLWKLVARSQASEEGAGECFLAVRRPHLRNYHLCATRKAVEPKKSG